MLILPPGHAEEVARRRAVQGRERWIIGSVLGLVAVIVVVVAIAFTSVQRKSQHGCIDVSAATVIGGSDLYRCGRVARELCTAPPGPSQTTNVSFQRALAEACRKAGLPAPPVPAAG